MGKLIRGMDYRKRGHRSGYEFVMLPRPFFIHAEFRNIKFPRDIIGFLFYSGLRARLFALQEEIWGKEI